MNRRKAIKNIGLVGATGAMFNPMSVSAKTTQTSLKGNINHSVCQWCYPDLSLDALCQVGQSIGLKGIDLIGPSGWSTLKKYNLVSTMCNGAEISLTAGFNHREYHSTLIENYRKHCLLYTSPSPRDRTRSRMPSSA